MPQKNNPNGGKKKKGRAPKHQNTFAFRHNPKSKKTEKILSSPNVGVCRRCWEKIEWRKKYRKYKPRTQPGKCNNCSQKNVLAAYHTICTKCAGSDAVIAAMEKRRGNQSLDETNAASSNTDDNDISPVENEVVEDRDTDKDESEHCTLDADDCATDPEPSLNANTIKTNDAGRTTSKRRIRVCAVCTQEPALSKYSNMDGVDEELQDQIIELEDVLDSGVHIDGHKLTLREVKGVERQLEKLNLEAKGRLQKNDDDDEEANSDEEEDDGQNSRASDGDEKNSVENAVERGESDDDANDPFLLAIGGKDKLLVGEDYQKMLLAREKQECS